MIYKYCFSVRSTKVWIQGKSDSESSGCGLVGSNTTADKIFFPFCNFRFRRVPRSSTKFIQMKSSMTFEVIEIKIILVEIMYKNGDVHVVNECVLAFNSVFCTMEKSKHRRVSERSKSKLLECSIWVTIERNINFAEFYKSGFLDRQFFVFNL